VRERFEAVGGGTSSVEGVGNAPPCGIVIRVE